MKRCLNCRKTYEEELSECPHCGYRPRSKAAVRSSKETTQEFDAVKDTKTYKKTKPKNIYASSRHAGAFYLQGGERLNKRYSVLSVMGFGAFGVAYECFDSFNQANVVIKEYMPSYLVTIDSNGRDVVPLSDEAEVTFSIGADSFIDESNKLNDNDVKCVPKMVECFKQNNTSYVVTELVHGEALSSIIKRKGKLSYHAAITIITSVLQGLRKLNKVGIIHGDICPDNIIVTSSSETYLLDYNLSDFNKNVYTQRDSGKLRAGYSALEMYYMNMEQGPWTDVYAAAATMYKMLTGVTIPSAIKRKTSDSLSSVSKLGIPITPGAEKAMFKALKVDYEKRTKNPEDFLNGLMGDGFDNLSVEKTPKPAAPSRPISRTPEAQRSYNSSNPNKILNGILIFLVLAIIAVVIWLFIAGIFTLPSAVTDFLGKKTDDLIPDTTSIFERKTETDTEIDIDTDSSDDENDVFYEEPSSQEEENTSSKSLFNIDSRLEDLESYIDSGMSAVESFFGNDTSSYAEDYSYDDGNDVYYDDPNDYEDYNEAYSSEPEYYSDVTSEVEPPSNDEQTSANPISDFVNGIINR